MPHYNVKHLFCYGVFIKENNDENENVKKIVK
jgi:hypothetical protein